ncbi:hypothetical protein Psi01_81150 [Planobispora siamensis]|uniref:Uncharacterized protein n=1 Tax=Planobispora siamensis TaxID=936338 RepID=A0A8J3SQ78_9ACTN|nr:hypothetical protein Psi01_81150 [Planobispora siamensis]
MSGLLDALPHSEVIFSRHGASLSRAGKIDRRALAKMLDPALPYPDATRNPHVVPFTGTGGTDTGNCPDAC